MCMFGYIRNQFFILIYLYESIFKHKISFFSHKTCSLDLSFMGSFQYNLIRISALKGTLILNCDLVFDFIGDYLIYFNLKTRYILIVLVLQTLVLLYCFKQFNYFELVHILQTIVKCFLMFWKIK